MLRIARTLLLLFCIGACAWSARADDLSQRYEALRKAHQSLRADPERRTYRHHWENLTRKLEQLLEADPPPTGRTEVRVRYELGSTWRDLYEFSRVKADLVPARDTFAGIVQRHPDDPLADDALFQLGEVRVKLGELRQARQDLLRLLRDYPDGNRIDEAQFLLEKIAEAEGKAEGKTEPAKVTKAEKGEAKAADGGEGKAAGKGEAKADKGDSETGAPEISAVKVWTNPDYTRLVLHLTGPAGFEAVLQKASAKDQPSELVIDLPDAALAASFEKTLTTKGEQLEVPVRGGLVEGVTLQRRTEGGLRLRLNVERLRSHRVTPFTSPHRLLIDLFGDVGQLEERDELETVVLNLPQKREKAGVERKNPKYTIVIDAGHGGEDPGAKGPGGTFEKDITLAMAKQVRKKLSTLPGVHVIMTRDEDVFIPLDERTDIANRNKADLFISIHCNANPNHVFSGIETYYLDTASDEGAAKLASRENASVKNGGSDLAFILQDLVIEGNVRYSLRLAQAVHESMLTNLRKAYPPKSVKDLGVKTALFYVLFGAQMPSILVETAFISNETEERRLKSALYQGQVAEAIKAGVKRYTKDSRVLSRMDEPGGP